MDANLPPHDGQYPSDPLIDFMLQMHLIAAWTQEVERQREAADSKAKPSPCVGCSKRDTCIKLCQAARLLAGPENPGRSKKEHSAGDMIDDTIPVARVGDQDVWEMYKPYLALISAAQREVLTLHLRDGLTWEQIGKKLNRAKSTVWERYRRGIARIRRLRGDDGQAAAATAA